MLRRMAISSDDVRHVAALARLTLTPEEVERFTKDLSGIFTLIHTLSEVDTSNVEPIADVNNLSHITREDVLRPTSSTPDALLAVSPLPIREHQIETPSAHGNH